MQDKQAPPQRRIEISNISRPGFENGRCRPALSGAESLQFVIVDLDLAGSGIRTCRSYGAAAFFGFGCYRDVALDGAGKLRLRERVEHRVRGVVETPGERGTFGREPRQSRGCKFKYDIARH